MEPLRLTNDRRLGNIYVLVDPTGGARWGQVEHSQNQTVFDSLHQGSNPDNDRPSLEHGHAPKLQHDRHWYPDRMELSRPSFHARLWWRCWGAMGLACSVQDPTGNLGGGSGTELRGIRPQMGRVGLHGHIGTMALFWKVGHTVIRYGRVARLLAMTAAVIRVKPEFVMCIVMLNACNCWQGKYTNCFSLLAVQHNDAFFLLFCVASRHWPLTAARWPAVVADPQPAVGIRAGTESVATLGHVPREG